MNEQTNPELPPDDALAGQGAEPDVVNEQGHGDQRAQEPEPGSAIAAPADFDIHHVKRVLEAALLSSTEPLTVQQLKRLFGGQVAADNIRKVLDELKGEWSERSIELTSVASGWRFRVKPEYQEFIDRISNEKPPRYSRAVLETLAIIAYRQPVTRGDIEEIRGVAVSPPTLNALEERGWVETVGYRETPGRPALFATTRKFLDDLNLRSVEELPPLEELQSALEPAPHPLAIEAAGAAPEQDSLIAEEPSATENTEQQEPNAHAG
jgi:segregation and condensation protein B